VAAKLAVVAAVGVAVLAGAAAGEDGEVLVVGAFSTTGAGSFSAQSSIPTVPLSALKNSVQR
jgi:hypothetical protein